MLEKTSKKKVPEKDIKNHDDFPKKSTLKGSEKKKFWEALERGSK